MQKNITKNTNYSEDNEHDSCISDLGEIIHMFINDGWVEEIEMCLVGVDIVDHLGGKERQNYHQVLRHLLSLVLQLVVEHLLPSAHFSNSFII